MSETSTVRVLAADAGRLVPSLGHVANRFMIDGADAGGRVAVLQHHFEPKALAAPMHRHHDEDEYTFVLSGLIGAVLGDQEAFGKPGDLIFKPEPPTPEKMARLAGEYRCDLDFETTFPLIQRHGLRF